MRLSAEVLDHIKKWYAKCEEADCMPENGLTIGRLLDTIEALQQENEQLADETIKLMKENAKNSNKKDELVKVLKQVREAIQRAKENFEPYGEYEYDVRYDLEEALAEIDKAIGGKKDE